MVPRDRCLIHWFGGLVWCLVLLVGRLLRDSLFGPPLILPRQISAAERYHQKEISKEKKLERKIDRLKSRIERLKNRSIISDPREYSPNNSNLCRNCVNLCQARVYRCMLLGCSTNLLFMKAHGLDLTISPKREAQERLKRSKIK